MLQIIQSKTYFQNTQIIMKIINETLKKGQYLEEILTEIPTNTILKKRVTGCGATTLEIKNKTRNSIIIEPNVPVIEGKKKKYPQILCAVKEGVDAEDIMDYIQTHKGYKKIMTTPESFPKVIKAMDNLGINYYKDYMLLFDECDKIIKDNDFRRTIMLPIEDFFLFQHKALVSATPIIPTDPRFEQQGFEILEVQPNYDYKKNIQLVTTNNVVAIFRQILEQIKPEDQVCFFINKTDMIQAIIEKFDLKKESKIFCSDRSVENLKKEGYKNAYHQLQKFAKYNFFTSRFFSAVDIEIKEKPVIVIVTDLFNSDFTMIDPKTEAIQIIGRFRNGHGKILHIANCNYRINKRNKNELLNYLEGCEDTYNILKKLKENATSEGAKDTLTEVLEKIFYAQFINKDGSKNYFNVDNWIDI